MNIKKYIILLLILVSIFALCSCEEAKTPETTEPFEEKPFTKYDVYRDGDVYYIVTDGRAKKMPFDEVWQSREILQNRRISFKTFEEMRNAIYSNGLSSYNMMYLYVKFPSYTKNGTRGRIISELKYAPIVPDGLEESIASMYYNMRYGIVYNGDNDERIEWIYYPKEFYKTLLEGYTSYFNNKNIVESTKTDDGETVYIYQYKSGDEWSSDQKQVRYTLQAEGKTFAVDEIYKSVDATVPQELHMYSIDGEGYEVIITNMTERPSKEWLLSFGIEEAPRDVYENVIVVE